jgi:hypothetical protein
MKKRQRWLIKGVVVMDDGRQSRCYLRAANYKWTVDSSRAKLLTTAEMETFKSGLTRGRFVGSDGYVGNIKIVPITLIDQ